jgi:hypothetical protein
MIYLLQTASAPRYKKPNPAACVWFVYKYVREKERVVRQWVKDNIDLFNCTRRLALSIYKCVYTGPPLLCYAL